MHVEGKNQAACRRITWGKESVRERPKAYARAFAWRTNPRRWPRLLYTDAPGPPLGANNIPAATPAAPTVVHRLFLEVAEKKTKPPTHLGGSAIPPWPLRWHPFLHTCDHASRTPTSLR